MQCVAGTAGHAAVEGGILLALSLALPLEDVDVFISAMIGVLAAVYQNFASGGQR